MNAKITVAEQILAIEEERCRCIVEQRYDRLGEILSDRLVHTHTRGNFDDRESYLSYVGGVIESLELRREGLRMVATTADTAVLHGKQINRARRRGHTEEVVVEAIVTQVFALEDDGQWRMVAFHSTPLGAPPPAVPR